MKARDSTAAKNSPYSGHHEGSSATAFILFHVGFRRNNVTGVQNLRGHSSRSITFSWLSRGQVWYKLSSAACVTSGTKAFTTSDGRIYSSDHGGTIAQFLRCFIRVFTKTETTYHELKAREDPTTFRSPGHSFISSWTHSEYML